VFDDDVEPEPIDIRLWLQRPTWMSRAACTGLATREDLFFPARGEATGPAKAICRGCSVRADCLDFAMINGEKFGVWGGLSGRERRRLRRSVRAA
jgi:WhiB family redox-sensing transcriptional regulator